MLKRKIFMAILELHLSETLDEMLDIRKTFLIPCYPGSSGSVEFPTLPSAFRCDAYMSNIEMRPLTYGEQWHKIKCQQVV